MVKKVTDAKVFSFTPDHRQHNSIILHFYRGVGTPFTET